MKNLVAIAVLFSAAASADEMVVCSTREPAAVSSAQAAIAAARQAWSSVYEKAHWHKSFSPRQVAAAEPFSASLKNGVWFVSGKSLAAGGSPTAQVCASDGSVAVSSK
jgi:hypothetical protein